MGAGQAGIAITSVATNGSITNPAVISGTYGPVTSPPPVIEIRVYGSNGNVIKAYHPNISGANWTQTLDVIPLDKAPVKIVADLFGTGIVAEVTNITVLNAPLIPPSED